MLRRVVIGVAIACLMGGAAYAVDEDPAVDNECTAQLTAVEETVHDKIESSALSEADAEKVNELLDVVTERGEAGAIWSSVRTSTSSRAARPVSVKPPSASSPRLTSRSSADPNCSSVQARCRAIPSSSQPGMTAPCRLTGAVHRRADPLPWDPQHRSGRSYP